jgi:hypothetical protein
VPFQTNATRLWKRLGPHERLDAATQFWKEPPAEAAAGALAAIVRVRRMRPQAARALSPEQKASALAQLFDPGETVASALVVCLHLGARRPMLSAFLDLLGIPHEDGVLKEEAAQVPAPDEERARTAVKGLAERFPANEIETYLNALWLQDENHWRALVVASECLATEAKVPSQDRAGS